MGRSVSYPFGAEVLFLVPTFGEDLNLVSDDDLRAADELGLLSEGEIEPDEAEDYFDFDDLIEDFQQLLLGTYPGVVYKASEWVGREDLIVAKSEAVAFGVSEYMGLVALWAIATPDGPLEDYRADHDVINHIVVKAFAPVREAYNDKALRKVATFSNGEAVYEPVS